VRNREYNLGVSVGVAHFVDDKTDSIEELVAEADRAMYEQKRSKRTREGFAPAPPQPPRIEAVA